MGHCLLIVLSVSRTPAVSVLFVDVTSRHREYSFPSAVYFDLNILQHLETPHILAPVAIGAAVAEIYTDGACEHLAVTSVVVLGVDYSSEAFGYVDTYCTINMLSLYGPAIVSARFECAYESHFVVALLE